MLCHLSTSIVTWPWYGEFECEGCVLCVHQTILRLVTVRTVLDIFSSLDVTIKATSSSVLLSDPPPHHPCYSVILILIIRVTQWSSSPVHHPYAATVLHVRLIVLNLNVDSFFDTIQKLLLHQVHSMNVSPILEYDESGVRWAESKCQIFIFYWYLN